ncbi:uncharacterized protein LOC136008640 isoform X3 [Lathamus discolor]|uniref:uncharacterized protein LOC136008640 isoform X3 n=1 Tax=Lathamus discolor TaxID=678569 RepID=UPI0032B7F689
MANEEEQPSALSDNQVFLLTCIYLPASLLSLLGSGSVLAVTSWRRRCCHIQASPTGCQGWALASAEPQEHHCWVNAQWDREGSRGCRMMPSTQLPTCSQCQAWEGRGCGSSSEPGVMPPASTNAVPCPQLRPLCLLALADLLAAASVLGTATIQVLPAPVFIPAYAACPYGWMLATTFYAISFLMVVVYAFESYRMVHGWRARHMAALQEGSGCLEHLLQELPYVLAWLVPALTLLGQLIARGTSLTDIAPGHLEPIMPQRGNGSHETYSLYCSSCLLLIHRAQDICYEYVSRKDVGLEGKIIFFLYLLLVLSCCTLLYHRVQRRCQRDAAEPLLTLERDGFAGRSPRSGSRVSHYFQLVFLLCWAPAFLLTLLSFTSIKPTSVFALYIATALSTSLQGFLHSLVYGWLRHNFWQEVVGKSLSLQHPRGLRAFYDESLGAVP